MAMEKTNYPVVDISDVRKKYQIIDIANLDFKAPNNSDALQSREFYGTEPELSSLKASILERGLLEAPIVMEPASPGDKYRVLEGNRRCHSLSLLLAEGNVATAAGKALSKVRCEVRPSVLTLVSEILEEYKSLNPNMSSEEQEEVSKYIESQVLSQLGSDALVRNTNRLNWSPIEQARSIKLLLDSGVPMEKVVASTGYAENTIKSRLSLLSKEEDLPEVIEALDKGEINFTVGKLLGNVKDAEARSEILEQAKLGASAEELKTLINEKEEKNKQAGGSGIKTQSRATKATTTAKVKTVLGVRKESDILAAIASLTAERSELQELDDDASANTMADVDCAIKVLQWVLNPADSANITSLFFGNN
jgi:ParB-like chromosome segregation protein Spo0J